MAVNTQLLAGVALAIRQLFDINGRLKNTYPAIAPMPLECQPSFCGKGPSGSPARSVVEAKPAAFPEIGFPSALQWSYITGGTLSRSDWACRGASISWIARPTSRCHSMWPFEAGCPGKLIALVLQNKRLTMEKPDAWIVGDDAQSCGMH